VHKQEITMHDQEAQQIHSFSGNLPSRRSSSDLTSQHLGDKTCHGCPDKNNKLCVSTLPKTFRVLFKNQDMGIDDSTARLERFGR